MPANTPLGYPYPLPTEPVAEGAQAIRNLAEAINVVAASRRWARVTGANQAVSTGVFQAIAFNAADADTDAIWTVATSTRLTCKTAGLYAISGFFEIDSTTGGTRRGGTIRLTKAAGGTVTVASLMLAGMTWTAVTPDDPTIALCGFYPMLVGDYVELMAFQDQGANRLVNSPVFAMVRIGA